MARFKYLGNDFQPGVIATPGPMTIITLHKKDGTSQQLTPISPATEFVVDVDIGYDITESRSLRSMRADSRFEELP